MSLMDTLSFGAKQEMQKRGLQVFVKSSISPEIKIFDADNLQLVESEGEGGTSLVDVGVTLKDRDGKIISNFGGKPDTNYLLAGSLVALILMLIFFFVRGVIK